MSRGWMILIPLLLSLAALADAPTSEPFAREVSVSQAGWHRAPVDGHIWRHAHGRILAFDASGKPLPCGILPVEVLSPASEEAQPRLVKFEEEDEGLTLYLQVDRLAGRHDRLTMDFGDTDLLSRVMLWGSMDGKTWSPMAQGALFRLGLGERMQGTALKYPTSGFDHLKLILPKGNQDLQKYFREFRVGNIRLNYSPENISSPWMDETVDVHPSDPALAKALSGEDEILLRLDLPSGHFPAQSLNFVLARPHTPFPVSFLRMKRGMPCWEYSCTLDTDVQSMPVPGGRLETPGFIKIPKQYGTFDHVVLQRPREEIVFFTDKPGIVTLTYGGVEERPLSFPPVHRQTESREATLGPVVEHPMALALSPELIQLASEPTEPQFKPLIQWRLDLPYEPVPGQWFVVELNPELLSAGLDAGKGGWGIVGEGKLVASFSKVDPVPVPVSYGSVELLPDRAFPMQSSSETIWSTFPLPVWLMVKVHAHGEPVKVTVEMPLPSDMLARVPPGRSTRPWRTAGEAMIECDPWTTDGRAILNCTSFPAGKALITLEGKNLPPPKYIDICVAGSPAVSVFSRQSKRPPAFLWNNQSRNWRSAGQVHLDGSASRTSAQSQGRLNCRPGCEQAFMGTAYLLRCPRFGRRGLAAPHRAAVAQAD